MERRIIECKICFLQYDTSSYSPISLRCGHTLCQKCINGLMNTVNHTINCPFCNTPFPKYAQFPKNYAILELIEEPNLEGRHILPEKEKEWTCEQCTYINLSSDCNCKICNIKRRIDHQEELTIRKLQTLAEEQIISLQEEYKRKLQIQEEKFREKLKSMEEEYKKTRHLEQISELEESKTEINILKGYGIKEPIQQRNIKLEARFVTQLSEDRENIRIYDIANKTTKRITIDDETEFPYASATCSLDNKIYIAGTYTSGISAKSVYCINGISGKYKRRHPMSEGRSEFCLIAINQNELCAMGGSRNIKTCEKYSISKDEWRELPSLNQGRCRHAACYFHLSEDIYIFGGGGVQKPLEIERLNISTIPATHKGEKGWEIVQLKDKSHRIGGHSQSQVISPTEILIFGYDNLVFDVQYKLTLRRKQKPPNSTGYLTNYNVSSAIYKEKIYCFNDSKNEIIVYNINSRKWEEVILLEPDDIPVCK